MVTRIAIGTVILNGASYILNKVASEPRSDAQSLTTNLRHISSQVDVDAAAAYLTEFGDRANLNLKNYEKFASIYLSFNPQTNNDHHPSYHQLKLLNNLTDKLKTELNHLDK